MISIRKARPEDLEFLVEADLLEDGYTVDPDEPSMTEEELAAPSKKNFRFRVRAGRFRMDRGR